MKKDKIDIEADYYYNSLMHYIRECNPDMEFDMNEVSNNTYILDRIYDAIKKAIFVGRDYLLTEDYLFYLASIYRGAVKDYLWEIRDCILHLSSNGDELAITEMFEYYDFLYETKHQHKMNFKTTENTNEYLILNLKLKNQLIEVDYIIQTLAQKRISYAYYPIIYETLLIILSYCTFYKIEFNTYQDYITNIVCNAKQYIEKLQLNGIIQNYDNYSVIDQKIYYIKLLKYVLSTLDKNVMNNKTIK